MAGPIAGYAQQAAFYQAQQQTTSNLGQQTQQAQSTEPKARQIEPQGTRTAGSEESDNGKNETPFNVEEQARAVLAQQEQAVRGAVINLLI